MQVINFFFASDCMIYEIKRTDLKDEKDLSRIYFWIFVDSKFRRLNFKSMTNGEVQNVREFECSTLKWNNHGAGEFFDKKTNKTHLVTRGAFVSNEMTDFIKSLYET